METLNDLIETALTLAFVGGVGGLAYGILIILWDHFQPPKPKTPTWNIVMSDPDGIPIRQDAISAKGMSRLITEINSGYYK